MENQTEITSSWLVVFCKTCTMYCKACAEPPDPWALYTPCMCLVCALYAPCMHLVWCVNLTDIVAADIPCKVMPGWCSNINRSQTVVLDTAWCTRTSQLTALNYIECVMNINTVNNTCITSTSRQAVRNKREEDATPKSTRRVSWDGKLNLELT